MDLFKAHGLELWRGGARLLGPLDLTLRQGMRVALTGRAGSGQSELLAVLAGVMQPESGSLQPAPGTTVALAQQPRAAAARMSVADYAAEALAPLQEIEQQLRRLEQRLDSAEALARYGELAGSFETRGGYRAESELRELLAAFGLPADRSGQTLDSLSGGELRRLELARTLAVAPDVLLLDDPTAGLDPEMQDLLAQRLKRTGGAVVFSSHDRHFMNRVATHTAEIRDGLLTLRRGGFPRRAPGRTPARGAERRQLLATEGLKLLLESGSLLSSGPLTVAAFERIVLLGPNGSGKSSLLDLIGHDLHSGSGSAGIEWQERVRLRYVDQQHAGLDPELSPLENLSRLMSPQRARQLLGLVGSDVRRVSGPVAGHERSSVARAGLAAILADESDLLLLDEPENGLDLPGIQLLEETLEGHTGAVILVTHDRQLAAGFATRVWAIEDGVLRDYRGGMDGYASGRLRLEDGLEAEQVREASPAQAEEETLAQLEEQLAETDERLLDTLGMPDRQLERLKRRQRELVSRLMERYDGSYPQPAPRYRVREGAVLLEADSSADGTNLEFIRLAGVRPALRLKAGVAHLLLEVPADRCLLPWAERALLNAATRLAFYVLDVRLVQHWSQAAPAGLLLEEAGSGWHALARSRFEQLEGWQRAARRRRRRPRRKRQA